MSLRNPPPGPYQSDGPSVPGDAHRNIAGLVDLRLQTRVEPLRNSRLRNYFLGYREFMEAPPSPTPSASDDELTGVSALKHTDQADKRTLSATRFRPQRRASRSTGAGAQEMSLSPISPDNDAFLPNRAYGPSYQSIKRKGAAALSSSRHQQSYTSTERSSSAHSTPFRPRSKNGNNRISKARNYRTHSMRLRSKAES